MDRGCDHLKELMKAEIPCLKAAMGHRRYLLSKREGKKDPSEVDWGQAQASWLDEKGDAWSEGFKACYCNYVCMKEKCDGRDLSINSWRKYANGD